MLPSGKQAAYKNQIGWAKVGKVLWADLKSKNLQVHSAAKELRKAFSLLIILFPKKPNNTFLLSEMHHNK